MPTLGLSLVALARNDLTTVHELGVDNPSHLTCTTMAVMAGS